MKRHSKMKTKPVYLGLLLGAPLGAMLGWKRLKRGKTSSPEEVTTSGSKSAVVTDANEYRKSRGKARASATTQSKASAGAANKGTRSGKKSNQTQTKGRSASATRKAAS